MGQALRDRIALITGGGRGIGAATAQLFADEGARVAVMSRTRAEVEAVAKKIGERAMAIIGDVSDEASVRSAFAQIEARFGLIDILINNAGAVEIAPIAETSIESFDRVMAVNVRGTFLCSREAFAHFRKSKRGGSIVNLSSLAGVRGTEKFPGLASYVAAKFGVIGLTEALAAEGKAEAIRVNCVAPGAVDTEMLRRAVPHLKTKTQAQDIARTLLYLADVAQSGSVNGSTLEIYSNL